MRGFDIAEVHFRMHNVYFDMFTVKNSHYRELTLSKVTFRSLQIGVHQSTWCCLTFSYSTNSAFYSWAHTTQWTLRFTLILKRYFALKTATILSLSLHENADYSICVCIASISSLGSFTIQKIKNENEVCTA